MERRNKVIGLVAMMGIWLTAGLSLPFVNVLKMFTPEQLLVARGFLTALMAFVLAKGKVLKVDRYTLLIGACVPFASLGLYKGVREWGAGPTIIVVTATPVINFLFTFWRGRQVPRAAFASLGCILGGVMIAHWGGSFSAVGLLWSIVGTVFNGLLYELFVKAKSTAFQRCFWGAMGMGIIGLVGSYNANWTQALYSHELQVVLFLFALVGGLLYWLANLVAFEKLPKDIASVLAQGETPAVILIAWLLLGERLTFFQGLGVLLALYGAWYLSEWVANQPPKRKPWARIRHPYRQRSQKD